MHHSFRGWQRMTGLAIAALCLLAASTSPIRHELGWIDAVTGSKKTQTRWLGIQSTAVIHHSALEKWAQLNGHASTNQWTLLYDTSFTALGHRSFSCGVAPEIYELSSGQWNVAFVRHSTDQELEDFLVTMKSGDKSAKEKAVKAAIQKVFETDIAASTPAE